MIRPSLYTIAPRTLSQIMNLFNMPAASNPAVGASRRMTVTIYHNPACSTSRKVLGLLKDAGVTPNVVEYLKTPPSRTRLKQLLRDMGMKPRDILRKSGTPYEELGLGDPALTDDQILDAIETHPILMQRPILVTDKGVRLCRPIEKMHEILPA
jgi:arsenate reductase (glutaredoxin)